MRIGADRAAWACWCVLLGGPVLLHLPELLGVIQTDPRLFNSGLGVGFHGNPFGGQPGYLDPNSAFTAQALGHVAAESWLRFAVPWWNPWIGIGAPLAAEMQPAALFLPFILLMHFQQGWLWLHVLLQMIAAAGAYLLLRALGLSRPAALCGAIIYAGGGTFAWFSHGPERVAAFLPWMLHGAEVCRRKGSGAAVLAVATALSIYAGFPETAYLDGLLLAAWAALRTMQQRGGRWRYAGRIAAGGIGGVLLAMPAVWPFVQYLAWGDVGQHGAMATGRLAWTGVAMMLLPYVNGPISAFGAHAPLWRLWGQIGGYIGIAATLLGLAGALGGRTETGLRWLLAVWIGVCLARTGGVAPVVWVSNLIPLVAQTAFYRYIVPAIAMACAVLAGLAIDDWRLEPSNGRIVAAGMVSAGLVCGAAWLSLPVATVFWGALLYRASFIASLSWALGWGALACAIMMRRPGPAAVPGLVLLICLDVGGTYLLARAGGQQHLRFDAAPMHFLQAHAAAGRIISLRGGLGPNETAWHAVAGIDETMLPAPLLWSRFLRSELGSDAIVFHHADMDLEGFLRLWPVYRALGVGWIVTGAGQGVLGELATVDSTAPRSPVVLQPGATLQGVLDRGLPGDRPVKVVGLEIGTFLGQSDGVLRLRLEQGGRVTTSEAPLAGAADNAPLALPLAPAVAPGRRVRWSLDLDGAHHPVAIWMYGAVGSAAPRFSVADGSQAVQPELVFRDATLEIYRMPDAVGLFAAAGCRIAVESLDTAGTDCPIASTLLRRELFFPGWTATVNGAEVAVRQDGLFQRIDLPAGRAVVRFAYAPPGIGWAYAAGLAGLAMTIVMGWPSRAAGRPRDC
jgi:hypothetical protein